MGYKKKWYLSFAFAIDAEWIWVNGVHKGRRIIFKLDDGYKNNVKFTFNKKLNKEFGAKYII